MYSQFAKLGSGIIPLKCKRRNQVTIFVEFTTS